MVAAFYHGRIAECEQHSAIHFRLAKAFAFLKRADLATLAAGKYPIDGDDCWASVQEAELKPCEGTKLRAEVHESFIDIQAPLDGPETYGLATIEEPFQPFDAERDCSFGEVETELLTLNPGEYAIFMPHNGAHAPCRTTGTPCKRRKVVIKVRFS